MNRVKTTLKAGVVAVGVLGSQIAVAVPSVADTADDPCGLAVSFLCRFMPIAPDLDGDVDLTTPLPPTGDAARRPTRLHRRTSEPAAAEHAVTRNVANQE